MDARSARVQTEESLKITQEAKRQGKTITVFTIVTIVFVRASVNFVDPALSRDKFANHSFTRPFIATPVFHGGFLRYQYCAVSAGLGREAQSWVCLGGHVYVPF